MSAPIATIGTAIPAAATIPATQRKAIDLAMIRHGTKDYLDFVDATKEVFFAYIYHRTGSLALAQTLIGEIFLDVLSRAMSLWWFGSLGLKLLLDAADRALAGHTTADADLDSVYLPTLVWLAPEERSSVATLHDALWSLPKGAQQLLVLSILIGLPDETIARTLRLPVPAIQEQMKTGRDLLLQRWQPVPTLAAKLQSLVFMPGMDLRSESLLRFTIVEKYNALRFRRYQWVIIAGLFAMLSNVIVASFLLFAVVTQPPTSLHDTRGQVASLDALVLLRQMAADDVQRSAQVTLKETRRIAAYSASRDLTTIGLSAALNALKHEEKQVKETDKIIRLLRRAETAAATVELKIIALVRRMVGWL